MGFFKQRPAAATNSNKPVSFSAQTYDDTGIHFSWLPSDADAIEATSVGITRLYQLADLGYGAQASNSSSLTWDEVYDIAADPELAESLTLLGVPLVKPWRVALASSGALSDPTFAITVSAWLNPSGAVCQPVPQRMGAALRQADEISIMPAELWQTLTAIAEFAARPKTQRTLDLNRKAWSTIRKHARKANAKLDQFLDATVILGVDKLAIGLRSERVNETKVIHVIPSFDEAPAQWLKRFDELEHVQERYDLIIDGRLEQVMLSPDAQTVLSEIKKFPGRRVAGARAEAFERNPISALGPAAAAVIDPDQFEAARIAAGIGTTEFEAIIRRDHTGRPSSFALQLETICGDDYTVDETEFTNAAEVKRFIGLFRAKQSKQFHCLAWKGFDLEILDRTSRQVDRLSAAVADLDNLSNAKPAQNPAPASASPDTLRQGTPLGFSEAEILDIHDFVEPPTLADAPLIFGTRPFDPKQFSARIAGYGQEEPYSSPYISKNKDGEGWFPENLHMGIIVLDKDQTSRAIALSSADRDELAENVQAALESDSSSVAVPHSSVRIPTAEAIAHVKAFAAVDSVGPHFDSQVPELKASKKLATVSLQSQKLKLLIHSNLEEIDYLAKRGRDLTSVIQTRIPKALMPHMKLHPHQLDGVAWLQNLWDHSPTQCSGALLADDMGLGKTLQLLTFIQSILEADPHADPFLIVAPVSLLMNWENEASTFFGRGTIPLLRLDSSTLESLRKNKASIAQELSADGLVNMLKANWLGTAKVVLTTYETMRNLEYALAQQPWSAIICDEAQKIKSPGAQVTRSAKKQNARFHIACTGTPVENTLVDLWCLFDFIQPGLLGSLKEFGDQYRSPIEAETQAQRDKTEELRELIAPQILRRMKHELPNVALPRKIFDQPCRSLPLNSSQLELYRAALSLIKQNVASLGGPQTHQLSVLAKLRMICSDPTSPGHANTLGDSVDQIEARSPKMKFLVDQLQKIKALNEKAIVFCEFLDLQETLKRVIAWRFGLTPDIINGGTTTSHRSEKSRQKRIDVFQASEGFNVLILSPVAVGFGVNIQAANHVVHFTRTWNPAKEDQATDRAYRIGQTRDVYVYCPVITSPNFKTFDAKLDALLEVKRKLAGDILNGSGQISQNELFAEMETPSVV